MSDTRIELDRAIREIVATHARTWPKTLTPQALINGLHALAVEVAQVAKAREARTDGSVSFCPDGETQDQVETLERLQHENGAVLDDVQRRNGTAAAAVIASIDMLAEYKNRAERAEAQVSTLTAKVETLEHGMKLAAEHWEQFKRTEDQLRQQIAGLQQALQEMEVGWREREQSLCRKAVAQGNTDYALRLEERAEMLGRCADELSALLKRAQDQP
jgi:chromosome segregation ATPase